MMQQEQIAALRTRLEEERARLVADIDTMSVENTDQDTSYGAKNHPAEDATEVFLRERNIALNNNASEIIERIDAAFTRMDEGSYGTCTRCGQPIATERLEALPYAEYCITCQGIVEQEGRE
jgi:DnaK suppressor protein